MGHFCPPGSRSTDLIESGSGSETKFLQIFFCINYIRRDAKKNVDRFDGEPIPEKSQPGSPLKFFKRTEPYR
jgi:hypothetical protein